MRKAIITLLGLSLVAGALAGPALAGKTTKGSYQVVAAPLPMLVDVDPNGCLSAVEGVHKNTTPVKAPGTGKLTVVLDGFSGDWDLYVLDKAGTAILGSSTGDQTSATVGLGGDPLSEKVVVPIFGKKTVNISVCNWAGGPTANVSWKYVVR